MDVAYVLLIVEVLKLLCDEQWSDRPRLARGARRSSRRCSSSRSGKAKTPESASAVLGRARVERSGATAGRVWEHLIETVSARGALDRDSGRMLEHYLRHGTLATRISKAVGLFPIATN